MSPFLLPSPGGECCPIIGHRLHASPSGPPHQGSWIMLRLLQLRIGSGSFLYFPLFIFPYSLHVNQCGECSLHGAEGFLGSMQRCPPPSLPRQRCTYILRAWRGIHGCSHTIRTQARVKPSHGSIPAGSAARKWYIT